MGFKVLLVGSTPELMNLMDMALREDERFDVVGATADVEEVVELASRLRPDAIVFHEDERDNPRWFGVLEMLRAHADEIELVQLAGDVKRKRCPVEAARCDLQFVESALSIGNTVALLLRAKHPEMERAAV